MFRHDSQFDCETIRLLTAKRLYQNMKTDKDLTSEVTFKGDKVKDEYFDRYDGIYAEILQATRFDESTDLSTTYLGKTDMTRNQIIKAEEKFPISGQGYTHGKLLDSTECSILIDTGANSHICQNPITCNVNHFMHYQNLLQQHKEFR